MADAVTEEIDRLRSEVSSLRSGATHATQLLAQYRGERDVLIALVRRVMVALDYHMIEISGPSAGQVIDEMRRMARP